MQESYLSTSILYVSKIKHFWQITRRQLWIIQNVYDFLQREATQFTKEILYILKWNDNASKRILNYYKIVTCYMKRDEWVYVLTKSSNNKKLVCFFFIAKKVWDTLLPKLDITCVWLFKRKMNFQQIMHKFKRKTWKEFVPRHFIKLI